VVVPQHRLAPARESPDDVSAGAEPFEAFFRRSYRALVGQLLVADFAPEIAEEAVQDAMTAAHRQWGEIANPGAWVRFVALRHAKRAAVRQRRRQARDHDHSQQIVTQQIVHQQSTDPFAQLDHADWVAGVISRLPAEQRAVMALFFDQLTSTEIGECLGKNEATVRSTLRHARQRLRQHLDHEQEDREES
jgi:RNA polymerase sigma factor (sigma-70 family)